LALAVVRDLRDARAPAGPDELAAFETDVLAGFVLARAAAGLSDGTVSSDVIHLEQVRAWFGRPLWDMEPADADEYFGKVLRSTAKGTRLSRAQALKTYFLYLELRHKVEVHQMTGRVVECPIDEVNRPRGRQQARLRIPPSAEQVGRLFAGWREELATCRKFAPTARNYTACRLMADVGLRVNEACKLDLADVKWDLGLFGKLHVRHGKGARGSGPRERMVPLINNAGATLRWFVEDVWAQFGDDHARPAVGAQERRRVARQGRGRGAARRPEGGRPDAPTGLARTCHAPRAKALLRLRALPGRHGPDCDPGDLGSCLDRHNYELRPRPRHPRRGCVDRGPAPGRRAAEGTQEMKWNLRLAAANRGIWKASELQRMLAERDLVISAGKMSGLWSGEPASIKLSDLDVICAVLGCGVEELLVPEPEKVSAGKEQESEAAAASASAGPPKVTPRRRDGRSLPPA
jgi:site-specific recombinase XerD/DNA-binding Xre family transcriptional regulator